VNSGSWLYDGTAESPVWIVRADFDFWYEIAAADGQLEPGERPDLNEDGFRYYVAFRDPIGDRFSPDGGGFKSIEEARRAAEQRVPTPIRWAS